MTLSKSAIFIHFRLKLFEIMIDYFKIGIKRDEIDRNSFFLQFERS